MLRRLRLLLLGLVLASSACDEPFASRDEIELVVFESLEACTGLMPMMCMRVVEWPGTTPVLFYSTIEGFEFEAGVRQRILVERLELNGLLADDRYTYRLLRVISRQEYPIVIPLD